ncbi:MAG TPA: DJ-1/PfpI family protein [Vicinamibacterales bacterium]|nr:DJ-1/PfpI family protein [Vicinamibacterales bacterium]
MNVAILIFPRVEVLDFAGPFEVFSRTRLVPGPESRRRDDDPSAPFHVFTVAARREPIVATGGLVVVPHYSFEDCPAVDLLVVPGGFGTRVLIQDEPTLAWIRRIDATSRMTTSVCTGSLLLAAAGLLEGKTATTHWAAHDLLASMNVNVDRDRRVVDVSDRIVTSAGVAAGIDMSFSIVERLFGRQVADETAKYIEYRRAITSS